jgi:hypothetical protein
MTQIHTPTFLDFSPAPHLRDDGDRTVSRRLMLIFGILSVGIILAGVFYYRNYEQRFRSEVERQLSAIAELKVSELVQWRKERFADANILYQNALFSGLVRRFFENPEDADALRQLRVWLGKFRFHYQYDRIFLLDASGGERMAVPDLTEPLAPHLAQDALVCLDSGQLSFLGFHKDCSEGPAHLSLLVRWDGGDVIFLNDLRFQAGTALKLVAGQIAQRGVNIVITSAPVIVTGDRLRLVEVFQNLLDNAVKFMGDQPAPVVRDRRDHGGRPDRLLCSRQRHRH